MKIARFVLAGFGGALALMTMGAARAEVVTISPDGSVERSDNAAVQQGYGAQSAGNDQQTAPQYDLSTPEAAARIRAARGANDAQQQARANNRRDNDRDRDNRNRRDRDDNDRHGRYHRGPGNITIIGNGTDVYLGGYPYNYGYPVGGYYGYRDPYFIDPGYGFPYYGGTYSNGGTTITYGNGLYGGGFGGYYGYGNGGLYQNQNNPNLVGGQLGMGPAWPNMGMAPGLGGATGTLRPPLRPQPRLPGAIYNPGRRR